MALTAVKKSLAQLHTDPHHFVQFVSSLMLFLLMKGEYARIVAEGFVGFESSISGLKSPINIPAITCAPEWRLTLPTIVGAFL